MTKLALVTEGKTDQIVLRNLLSQYFNDLSPTDFQGIQPYSDKTSGNTEGGWLQVYKWCLSNPPDLRKQLYGNGLFRTSTSPNYQAIIVHLDGDLCDKAEFQTLSDVAHDEFDLTQTKERGDYLKETLNTWLQVDEDEKITFATAIESIETWLLAGLNNDEDNPEADKQAEEKLLALYKKIQGKRAQQGQKQLKKDSKTYQKLSDEACKNVEHIVTSCSHFSKLCQEINRFLGE